MYASIAVYYSPRLLFMVFSCQMIPLTWMKCMLNTLKYTCLIQDFYLAGGCHLKYTVWLCLLGNNTVIPIIGDTLPSGTCRSQTKPCLAVLHGVKCQSDSFLILRKVCSVVLWLHIIALLMQCLFIHSFCRFHFDLYVSVCFHGHMYHVIFFYFCSQKNYLDRIIQKTVETELVFFWI